MRLKKRSWPVAIFEKDLDVFRLYNGTSFSVDCFRELPEYIDQEDIHREGVREHIPANVWLACYRESDHGSNN